jgi:chorismate lyase/3-hydroxybenzoate synthase
MRWEWVGGGGASLLRAASDGGLSAMAASVPDAVALGPAAFESRVKAIYLDVLARASRDGFHPLRFWNFIPGINDEIAPGLSRYMAFNAARHAGYRAVHHVNGALPGAIATASGVGASDGSLHVFCLATRERALPVENPRQVPAYEYSRKYGPLPPCFARGMLVRSSSPLLVIGGTASVRGEESVRVGDLPGQIDETLLNVRALIRAGCRATGRSLQREPLGALTGVRAYVVDETAAAGVRDVLAQGCGLPASAIELRVADLCRPDLLVEVEGVAALARVAAAGADA